MARRGERKFHSSRNEATGACYGDVGATVRKSGDVNGWVAGLYTVTYSETDSGGNSAPAVRRTVEVAPGSGA